MSRHILPFLRTRSKALTAIKFVVVGAVLLPAQLASAAASEPQARHESRAYGLDQDKRSFPIAVGSVIAEGRREGNLCMFDTGFGVGAAVEESNSGPRIRWQIQETCQVVIVEVNPEGSHDERTS